MPKYNITFNVKLDEQLTIAINASNETDALTAADVIACEIASDPEFLADQLQLHCTDIEPQVASYVSLTSARTPHPSAQSNDASYTSLASLHTQAPQPCSPCRNPSTHNSGYTRLI
jgi:hypothetical protein